jgi:hypothetical protein
MGLCAPQGKQLKVLLHPYVLSDGFHAPDCMDGLKAGVEWDLFLGILPGLQAVVGCFR